MGTVNRGAFQPTLESDIQTTGVPQIADRTAILGGAIITDIACMQDTTPYDKTRESQPITPVNDHGAAYASNYGDSFIFERIWVQPMEIDFGFIVEDSQQYIQVWNSSRLKSIEVTDIVVQDPDGTLLTYDPLPNTLMIFGDINYLLQVFNVGPPLQDTTYRFTVDGVIFDIHLSGVRVLPFDLDPNWDAGLKITYTFQSTIFTSKRLNEQRRPLSVDSWFSTRFTTDVIDNRSRINFNKISYGKDKIFGVPVFTEKIVLTACSQGAYSIYTADDLTTLYNLNSRTDYIILVDHLTGLSEVKLINSIESGVIHLVQPISDDFNYKSTYAYPCMFCFLKSFRSINETDDLVELSIEFEQYKS